MLTLTTLMAAGLSLQDPTAAMPTLAIEHVTVIDATASTFRAPGRAAPW